MTHDLDIPIAIHAGKNEDIAFRPIGGVSTIGGNLFKSKGGLGVLGIIYRPNYKQSVQGMVYSDHIYLKEIKGEDADHFHFDYMWEFYPKGWIFSTQISIEHAKAENTSDYAGIPGDFNNAHTDTQIDVNLQKDFLIFTLGLSSKLMYRLDTGDSTYALHSTGALVKKTRSDTEIMATPNISIPIFKDVQLYGWYSIDKVSSNIGKNDYIDRNFFNQVVGLAIKTTLSSY